MSSNISEITITPKPGNMGSVSVGATVTNGKITYGGNVQIQTPGGSSRFAAITSTSNPAVLTTDTTNPWSGTGFGYVLTDASGDQIVVQTDSSGNPTSYTNETTHEPATPEYANYACAGLGSTTVSIGWEDGAGNMQTATLTINVVPFMPIQVPIYTNMPTPAVATPAKGGLSTGAKVAIGATVLAVGGVGIAAAARTGAFKGLIGEAQEAMAAARGRHHHAGESRRKSMKVQSVLVPRSKFSKREATAWVRGHGYHVRKVDTTQNYYRFRQRDPGDFKVKRTIPLGDSGVKAVVGR